MAFQDTAPGRAPSLDEIRFFARGGRGELVNVSTAGKDAVGPWVEPLTAPASGLSTWLWPTAALVSDGRLLVTYAEMGCPVGPEFAACRGYMGSMTVVGYTLVEIENPADAPERWQGQQTPLVDRMGRTPSTHRLHWGSALLEDGGWLYVFGVAFGPNWSPGDVKLARTVPRDARRYDLWQFLTPEGWQMLPTGPTPADLQTVARGGATELSVERVVRNGQTWLLMVQQDFWKQEIVVRSAPALEIEAIRWDGPEAGARVRRLSLPALDPDTAGGPSWSVRTHLHHSSPDRSLLVSLYSGRLAGLRFVELPMSQLLD
jgi:hypothetical protein